MPLRREPVIARMFKKILNNRELNLPKSGSCICWIIKIFFTGTPEIRNVAQKKSLIFSMLYKNVWKMKKVLAKFQ